MKYLATVLLSLRLRLDPPTPSAPVSDDDDSFLGIALRD